MQLDGTSDPEVDVVVGAGGMAAYREAAKYTSRIALIDGGPLGTTCARACSAAADRSAPCPIPR